MAVSSKVTLNKIRVKQLERAQVRALELAAEALHTEVVQAQVIPRDTGALQNEKTFVDTSDSGRGHVDIITEGPYARRLYYHPEYNFHQEPWDEVVEQKGEYIDTERTVNHEGNPNAKGKWYEDWLPGGEQEDFAQKAFNAFYKKEAGI